MKIGTRAGNLEVISPAEASTRGMARWNCRCDCGTELVLNEAAIGRVNSCGCESISEDLTGQKFGMLTVLSRAEYDCDGSLQWLCRCDCGNVVKVNGKRLKNPKNSYPHPNFGCTTKHGHTKVESIYPGLVLDHLTVVEPVEDGIRGTKRWLCRCVCGTELIANESALLTHRIHSCGCVDTVEDIIGKRFGRLVVVKRTINYPTGQAQWICQCDCGNTKVATLAWLTRNSVEPSCGCYKAEKMHEMFTTHGMSKDPLNEVWASMKKRCENPNEKQYKNYGGRGIYVCERWQKFENFYEDMAPTYQPGLQLDRKENNGPYDPDNCHWATVKQNQRNKRSNRYITTYIGRKTVAEQAEISGVNAGTIKDRLKQGMPEELSIIPNPSGKRLGIETLKQIFDEEQPAVWMNEKIEKNMDEVVETANVQAKAIDEWGFGPHEVIIGEEDEYEGV